MKRRTAARLSTQVSMLAVLVNACLLVAIGASHVRAEPGPIRIVAFGDSLTAGYGLNPGEAFPAQLEKALRDKGYAVEVINAGVSGDTTAAGLQRFDWAFPEDANAAIVELGANDALRGIDPAEARQNLDEILTRLEARGIPVLIAGMKAPRNWGDDYVRKFDAIFPELARKHDALLYPFFLEPVAMRPDLNLDDGMHPNGRGVAEIVKDILPEVEKLIARVDAKRETAPAN
ncbi:MAG TPA: arylesterase [Hyphomicrobiaceae bacterium]